MRIGSLFSGAGGLDLAACEIFPNASIAWHSEINPAASRVLAHHWPDVPNLGSITEIDWTAIEPVDVLCGGFPCQDVSAAGRRAGLAEGTRSGLWSYMAEAVDVLRPRFVLIENVKGLLSAAAIRRVESTDADMGHTGTRTVLRASGAVLGDLADLGFDAEWTCIRASDVGACHRRERVFILAYPADSHRARPQGPNESARADARRAGEDTGGQHAIRHGGNAADVTLLPTPRTPETGTKGGPNQRGSSGDLMLPSAVASLLPTPTVALAEGGQRSRSGARSDELLLPGLVAAVAEGKLLPTPEAKLAHSGPDYARIAREGSGGDDPATAIARDQWGTYGTAIRRHEAACGRVAPSPSEPTRTGGARLSAPFAEWMMFWPAGWVTDPAIGLTRNEQLHIIGNGVCPPQAVAAFRYLLGMAS